MTMRVVKAVRRYDVPKQSPGIQCLPNNLLHIIFSHLGFQDKINAGLVCKEWEQLLQAGTAASRHWDIVFDVSQIARSTALRTSVGQSSQELSSVIGRWFAKRASAIKSVCLRADFVPLDDDGQDTTLEFMEAQLPMLAGCLFKYAPTLNIEFTDAFPFDGPLLLRPALLTLLCPMLKKLCLWKDDPLINRDEFAAICQLTCLEELEITDGFDISHASGPYGGVEALTSDISKLVNLGVLVLDVDDTSGYNPQSIGALQKLERLELRPRLDDMDIIELEHPGYAKSRMAKYDGVTIAPHLQGLKSLQSVAVMNLCLELVPWELCSLSALTRLDIRHSEYVAHWLPTVLSRLTRLAELTVLGCDLVTLPARLPVLLNLTMLDFDNNRVECLPDDLSNLRNLRELHAYSNCLEEVPVCALSGLTALSVIDLSGQQADNFQISSSLLPILHPGLVELSLEQYHPWDPISLFHQQEATAEVADRTPVPALHYSKSSRKQYQSGKAPISSASGYLLYHHQLFADQNPE